MPGYPSAMRVFALTHSRPNLVPTLVVAYLILRSLTDYRLGRKDSLDLRLLARADYKPRLYCMRKTRVEITNDTIPIDVHENIDNNDSYHADRFYGQSE